MSGSYFLETQHHEWILTNNLGGYALGTGNLINQRKYHGLLIAGNSRFFRKHLIADLEEKIEWRGERLFLNSTNYKDCIYPEGFLHLVKSWLRPYPVFLYSSNPPDNNILIKKEIFMDENSNTVVVKYINLSKHSLAFTLKPKLTMRLHHVINGIGVWDQENLITEFDKHSFHSIRELQNIDVFGYTNKGTIELEKTIYRECFYPWEAMRGYEAVCDQISPVKIQFVLKPKETNHIVFSDKKIKDFGALVKGAENRYKSLPLPKDYPKNASKDSILNFIDYDDKQIFTYKEYIKILEFTLKDFNCNNNIIAGFPWFGAWGRDTMIVLRAYLKMRGGYNTVLSVLKNYEKLMTDGLIPNMLPETGNLSMYKAIDATLWYLLVLYESVDTILKKKLDKTTKRENVFWAISTFTKVLYSLFQKRNENIKIREDGLLEIDNDLLPCTWMDAIINENAVTPRNGAQVETNALWYNILCAYIKLCRINKRLHDEKATIDSNFYDLVKSLMKKVKKSYKKFLTDDYLADRLVKDDPVREIRCNAIIATSLPFDVIELDEIEKVLLTAKKQLVTAYGLRTLSRDHFQFKKKYMGSQLERDLAYHQGSTWAWLFEPFVATYYKVYKDKKSNKELKKDISEFIHRLRNGFLKGHISSVAELWDGEHPHRPKGTPAQAWSVAALYSIEHLYSKL